MGNLTPYFFNQMRLSHILRLSHSKLLKNIPVINKMQKIIPFRAVRIRF